MAVSRRRSRSNGNKKGSSTDDTRTTLAMVYAKQEQTTRLWPSAPFRSAHSLWVLSSESLTSYTVTQTFCLLSYASINPLTALLPVSTLSPTHFLSMASSNLRLGDDQVLCDRDPSSSCSGTSHLHLRESDRVHLGVKMGALFSAEGPGVCICRVVSIRIALCDRYTTTYPLGGYSIMSRQPWLPVPEPSFRFLS